MSGETNMTRRCKSLLSAFAACAAMAGSAAAQSVPETREYSRKGELSPGAQAPSPTAMVAVITQGSPEKLKATLEYGERVYCAACVPLLEGKLLASDDERVRELSAWWLRRQPFAAPALLKMLKTVARGDASPVRRERAVEALGEFMDPHAFEVLVEAAERDAVPAVRVKAVQALARLNDPRSGAAVAHALADASPTVRESALSVALIVTGFRDVAALIVLLGDADAQLRAHAARLCGEYRVAGAEQPLIAMLRGDAAPSARKSAAWALGRIGGAPGRAALATQKQSEQDGLVLSAIEIAERMKARAP
jgi:HEAT repeat protein